MELPHIIKRSLHTTDYIRIGSEMLEDVRNGKLNITKECREGFCKRTGCSLNQYYAVLNLLIDLGAVRKKAPNYILNTRFAAEIVADWTDYLLGEE